MKTIRFSKIKLLSDLFVQLISSAIIIIVVDFIFTSQLFDKPINYILFHILSFMVLMILLYIFFIFATPTMTSVIFNSDHLIFKYVKGYGEKTILYKDIKWVRKAGVLGSRYTIQMNDENIPLTLALFKKLERLEIVETIKNRIAT